MTYHRLSMQDKSLQKKVFKYLMGSLEMFRHITEDTDPHIHIYTKVCTEHQADTIEVDLFLNSVFHDEQTDSGFTGSMEDPR